MKSLNEQITEVLERKRLFTKWNEHSTRLAGEVAKKQIKAMELKKKLENLNENIEGLHTMSVVKIMTLTREGNQGDLTPHQKAAASAKLQYQEAVNSLNELEREKNLYDEHLLQLGDVASEYELLLQRKTEMINDENNFWSEKLYEVTASEIEVMGAMQELSDAIDAGEHAYYSLQDTLKALEKASNWSTADMPGGGLVTSFMQNSHLDDAKASLHRTERRIRQFQDELIDIEQHENADLHIGNFFKITDYFYDELIVDWVVHSKISKATKTVIKVQEEVSEFVNVLKEKSVEFERKRAALSRERIDIIQKS